MMCAQELDPDGLGHQQRAVLAAPIVPSRGALAAIITGAGMKEVPDATGNPSHCVFRGTMPQYQHAINTMCRVPWVCQLQGVPDIGKAWLATGSQMVVPLLPPFSTQPHI